MHVAYPKRAIVSFSTIYHPIHCSLTHTISLYIIDYPSDVYKQKQDESLDAKRGRVHNLTNVLVSSEMVLLHNIPTTIFPQYTTESAHTTCFIPLLDFRSLWMMSLSWMYCIPGYRRCIVNIYLTMLQTNIGGINEMIVHQHGRILHALKIGIADSYTCWFTGTQITAPLAI